MGYVHASGGLVMHDITGEDDEVALMVTREPYVPVRWSY